MEYEDGYYPTMRLKWFAETAWKGWDRGDDSGEPKGVVLGYEGMRDYYVLKQLWVSDAEGAEPQWRPIDVER